MNKDIEDNLIANLLMCTQDNNLIANYIKLYHSYGFSEIKINAHELQKIYECSDKSVRNYNNPLEKVCLLKKYNPSDTNGKRQIAMQLRHPKEALEILKANTNKIQNMIRITKNEKIA